MADPEWGPKVAVLGGDLEWWIWDGGPRLADVQWQILGSRPKVDELDWWIWNGGHKVAVQGSWAGVAEQGWRIWGDRHRMLNLQVADLQLRTLGRI